MKVVNMKTDMWDMRGSWAIILVIAIGEKNTQRSVVDITIC